MPQERTRSGGIGAQRDDLRGRGTTPWAVFRAGFSGIMVGVVGLSPMLTFWLVSVIRALLKGDECNRSGENAYDADRALDPEPDEGKRRKKLGAACEVQPWPAAG